MELTDTAADRRRVSPAVAAWCAWSWQRSELTEVRHARIRPVVVLMLELAVMGAGVALLSNPDAPIVTAALMTVAGALAGLLLAWGLDAHSWRTSCWHYFHQSGHRRVGVCLTLRRGRLTVLCVHAVPRGQGLGAEAMNQVCTWADRNRQNLELTASSDDAARFYRRFGFATTHGRHMTRRCQEP